MAISNRRRANAELARLLEGRPNLAVKMSKSQVASALWDDAENALAARVLNMSDAELVKTEKTPAWYEDLAYPLPMTGQRITHNHVAAFAAITLFEGAVRPLTRTRRRPAKDRPAGLR